MLLRMPFKATKNNSLISAPDTKTKYLVPELSLACTSDQPNIPNTYQVIFIGQLPRDTNQHAHDQVQLLKIVPHT